ncbi:MAG: hypothetical protein AAF127_05850 [Pseudomonadota bacterium]
MVTRLKRSEPRFRVSAKGIAFAIAAVLGAGAALANASVNMLHTRAPAAALVIDANDPVALIRDAQTRIVAGDPQVTSDAAMLSIVQRSVRRLPINGPAFRLYGLSNSTGTSLGAMRAQMEVSDRMERRDLGAQLWLIENAVELNNVDRALRHYDKALRIEESSRALLYPVLTDALNSALIRERFVPYLAANPGWLESFLRYAVSNSSDRVSLSQLAKANGGWPKGQAFSSLDTELLTGLIADAEYEEAAAHFRRIEGVDAGILASLDLTDASTNWRLAPMTWQPYKVPGIETYVLASPQGGGAVEIEAEIEAGYTGSVARKFMALVPGRYRITAQMRAEDFSRQDVLRWGLTCAGKPGIGPVFREDVAFSEDMALDTTLTVPANCPVQALMISADTLVTTRYVKLVLASAKIAPAGKSGT